MASNPDTLKYIIDQLGGEKKISARKMFGEYCLYSENKVIGLVCDNTLFIKITPAGEKFAMECERGSPYIGAKPAFVIGDRVEDSVWLSELLKITLTQLPSLKKKTRTVSKKNKGKNK